MNAEKQELRRFGIIFGIALIVMSYAIIPLIKYIFKIKIILRLWPLFAGIAIVTLGITLPLSLKPLRFILKKILDIMKAIITPVTLTLVFYLILTPISLISRLFGKDFLDINWKRKKDSYWVKKEQPKEGLERYERQY